MQPCRFFVFFSPDLFMKISNFSKTVHTIFTKICSHFTPKGAPACAKASKSYDWDVRNIAKISPIMAKKQPLFDFFRFSQKMLIRFERKFLQSFYIKIESYMCNGIKIVYLGCKKHSQNQPKMAKKNVNFRFSQKLSIRFEQKFLQKQNAKLYCQLY